MARKYIVRLTEEERYALYELTKKGRTGARKLGRSHILLLADESRTDKEIAKSPHIGVRTVGRLRRRFAEGGSEKAPDEDPGPGGKRLPNGKEEALLVAEACTEPPEGRLRWTMRLLADRVVRLGLTEPISDETVRLISEKTI